MKQTARVRLKMLAVTRLPRKEIFYIDKRTRIGKLRIPGDPAWRAWLFRDGSLWYITHLSQKDDDHEKQAAIGLDAKAEHMRRKEERAAKAGREGAPRAAKTPRRTRRGSR